MVNNLFLCAIISLFLVNTSYAAVDFEKIQIGTTQKEFLKFGPKKVSEDNSMSRFFLDVSFAEKTRKCLVVISSGVVQLKSVFLPLTDDSAIDVFAHVEKKGFSEALISTNKVNLYIGGGGKNRRDFEKIINSNEDFSIYYADKKNLEKIKNGEEFGASLFNGNIGKAILVIKYSFLSKSIDISYVPTSLLQNGF